MQTDILDERNRRWDQPFGEEPLDEAAVGNILSLPAFEDVQAADFPAWLPLEKIIANDGRLRRFRKGEVIIRKGDYGSSLFAILEGEVVGLLSSHGDGAFSAERGNSGKSWFRSLSQLIARSKVPEFRATRRGQDRARATRSREGLGQVDVDDLVADNPTFTLRAPQMFGELAALTRSARNTSVFSFADDTLVFELRWQGLREIRDWSEPFRQRIDMLYQERGLVTRLLECPIFDHVGPEALDEIARESLFETFGNFDWTHRFKSEVGRQAGTEHIIDHEPLICEQGHYVDGLILINCGFARVSEKVDFGERTIGHLSRNDTFGLDEIADQAAGRGGDTLGSSLRAIGYVDVIRIPTSLVRKHVLPGLPQSCLGKRDAVSGSAGSEKMRQAMMDFVVDRRFINGENAMVINTDRCVGCDDCVRACATAHDNNPRFVRHGHSFENAMIANACMHCTDPVCLIGCPTGAIHQAADAGNVVIDDNTCIGCGTCANSCPYNNIRMVDIRDATGALIRDRDGLTISRATKCDLCADQLTGPACAQACPHDALVRINIRDTGKLLAWLE